MTIELGPNNKQHDWYRKTHHQKLAKIDITATIIFGTVGGEDPDGGPSLPPLPASATTVFDAASSFVNLDGDRVTSWVSEQGSIPMLLTQTDPAKRPRFVNNSVRFDGVNSAEEWLLAPSGQVAQHMFFVVDWDTTELNVPFRNDAFIYRDTANRVWISSWDMFIAPSMGNTSFAINGVEPPTADIRPITVGEPVLYDLDAPNTYDFGTISSIGGRNGAVWTLKGGIRGIVFAESTLTPSDRADIQAYLIAKYGITV